MREQVCVRGGSDRVEVLLEPTVFLPQVIALHILLDARSHTVGQCLHAPARKRLEQSGPAFLGGMHLLPRRKVIRRGEGEDRWGGERGTHLALFRRRDVAGTFHEVRVLGEFVWRLERWRGASSSTSPHDQLPTCACSDAGFVKHAAALCFQPQKQRTHTSWAADPASKRARCRPCD